MFDSRAAASIEPHGSFVVKFGDGGFVGRVAASHCAPVRAPQPGDSLHEDEPADVAGDAAFTEGYVAGHAAAMNELAEQRAQIEAVIGSLEALQPVPQAALAGLLGECVVAMIERSFAAVAIDPSALTEMARTMVAGLADEIEAVALHMHPADADLMADASLSVPLHPDATLLPGTVRLATRQGWLEDGLPVRLARFRNAIAGSSAA